MLLSKVTGAEKKKRKGTGDSPNQSYNAWTKSHHSEAKIWQSKQCVLVLMHSGKCWTHKNLASSI